MMPTIAPLARALTAASRSALVALLVVIAAGCSQHTSSRDGAAHIRAHYAKQELRIPMRDGVTLYTAVYSPRDTDQDYPILFIRTPYSVRPYGADAYPERLGPSEAFAREKFIFVYQDVRGRFMSEGEYVNMRPHVPGQPEAKRASKTVDESTDTYDTIEWLLSNLDNHNGKVGMWGISYPGFYSAAGMIDSHPALVAVSPQAPIADWFWDDMHRHGAFVLAMAFPFFSRFGLPRDGLMQEWPKPFDFGTPDGYRFFLDLGPIKRANELHFKNEIGFWNDLAAHPNYDAFWQERNILPHLQGVGAAVMTVGGWFDTEDLYGPLHIYEAVEKQNPDIFNMLVMGPWSHGGWARTDGDALGWAEFGAKTSLFYREHVELPFFLHFLKDGPSPALPEALVFETGRNRWHGFDRWPPATARTTRLFFREGNALSFAAAGDAAAVAGAPAAGGAEAGAAPEAHDTIVSDPAKPVPYTLEIGTRWSKNYMTEDQRFASRRPDVLVYQTEPLTEDITIGGPIRANLWVSTTGTDADWIVKIIDVHPGRAPAQPDAGPGDTERGGYEMLVRAEAFRGRFRNSYEHPEPFVPGEVTRVSFELWDVLHTFRKGHRIMVHVQNTWFPLIDRNPQRYVPNIFEASEEDFITATNRVYRSAAHPSSIEIGVVEGDLDRTEIQFPPLTNL